MKRAAFSRRVLRWFNLDSEPARGRDRSRVIITETGVFRVLRMDTHRSWRSDDHDGAIFVSHVRTSTGRSRRAALTYDNWRRLDCFAKDLHLLERRRIFMTEIWRLKNAQKCVKHAECNICLPKVLLTEINLNFRKGIATSILKVDI